MKTQTIIKVAVNYGLSNAVYSVANSVDTEDMFNIATLCEKHFSTDFSPFASKVEAILYIMLHSPCPIVSALREKHNKFPHIWNYCMKQVHPEAPTVEIYKYWLYSST